VSSCECVRKKDKEGVSVCVGGWVGACEREREVTGRMSEGVLCVCVCVCVVCVG